MNHSATIQGIGGMEGRWFLHNGQRCLLTKAYYSNTLDAWQIEWIDRSKRAHRTQVRVKRDTQPQLTFIRER